MLSDGGKRTETTPADRAAYDVAKAKAGKKTPRPTFSSLSGAKRTA
jgi:hypothetical protein